MKDHMNIIVVPLGYGEKVIAVANEIGIEDVTILHGRGANSTKEGLFGMTIEPEEDVILMSTSKAETEILSERIHEVFEQNCNRSGSIYVLPIN